MSQKNIDNNNNNNNNIIIIVSGRGFWSFLEVNLYGISSQLGTTLAAGRS